MADFQPMKDLELKPMEELHPSDTLKIIINMQTNLIKKYYTPNLDQMTPKEMNDLAMKVTIALEDEISELRGQLNWKWWKKPHEIDEKELKFEIIDIFFFTLTLMIIWKMSPEEIESYYVAKYRENVRRQENGY